MPFPYSYTPEDVMQEQAAEIRRLRQLLVRYRRDQEELRRIVGKHGRLRALTGFYLAVRELALRSDT